MPRMPKNCRPIVSVSGGKDSTATYLWAIDKFGRRGFEAVFADTGHEHPVTLNYVRNLPTMCGGPEVHWVRANFEEKCRSKGIEPTGHAFVDLTLWKGMAPAHGVQFCTEFLKLLPICRWMKQTSDGRLIVQLTGIRSGESKRRSKYPAWESADWGAFAGLRAVNFRPLLSWTTADVMRFLERKEVPPNPLYLLGYERVGCFPCIFARKSELARLPGWAWEKLRQWERRLGKTWFPAGTISHKSGYPTVDEVRRWARTVRGGKQFDLFAPGEQDAPSCMATWGQCE